MIKLLPRLAPFKHVIWDWNGTLLFDLEHTVKCVNTSLQKRNLPTLTQDVYKTVFRFPIRDYYESIGFDLEKESFSDLCDEYVDSYMESVFSCPLVEGAHNLLQEVKLQGKTQSILSASDQESLNEVIRHYSLNPLLDHVFGIEDKMAASKLHRGKALIEKAKIEKSQTVLIGDTDHDLEVGRSLGIHVILVTHGHQCAKKLKALHHDIFDIENS